MTSLEELSKVKFILDQDLCYSLDRHCKIGLNKLLQVSGATMQLINSVLSKINLSLLKNNDIQGFSIKIHEFKPDKKSRRWLYISSSLILLFFVFFIIDFFFMQKTFMIIIALLFMFSGLIIQLLFICRNGKILKAKTNVQLVHDENMLNTVKKHMQDQLPLRNPSLKNYRLKLILAEDASSIELVYNVNPIE